MMTLLTILLIAAGLPITFLVWKAEKDQAETIKWAKLANPITWRERI